MNAPSGEIDADWNPGMLSGVGQTSLNPFEFGSGSAEAVCGDGRTCPVRSHAAAANTERIATIPKNVRRAVNTFLIPVRHGQKESVNAVVIAKFGMKGASQYIPLANENNFSVHFGEHFNG